MAQPLTMTVKKVTLQGTQGRVEAEKDNGVIQGTLVLTMPITDARDFAPGNTILFSYEKV